MKDSQLLEKIKTKLHSKFPVTAHTNGYVADWNDNLIPGVFAAQFEADLRAGAGQELEGKFKALHSSSALAVNTFAPFKPNPADLRFQGKQGFTHLQFEQRLPTGLGGTPPNLDVWLQSPDGVIAIESKFLEYFTPKQAEYNASYVRTALPQADNAWWDVLQFSQAAGKQYLDTAQLVKHALGLLKYQQDNKPLSATLVYLFWEPVNAAAFDACHRHRQQIHELATRVANSRIKFEALSYNELWSQWNTVPHLATHLSHLRARYEVAI